MGAEKAGKGHHRGGQRHEGTHVGSVKPMSVAKSCAKDWCGGKHGVGEHVGPLALVRGGVRAVWRQMGHRGCEGEGLAGVTVEAAWGVGLSGLVTLAGVPYVIPQMVPQLHFTNVYMVPMVEAVVSVV